MAQAGTAARITVVSCSATIWSSPLLSPSPPGDQETVPARLAQSERDRLARVAATSGYTGYRLLPALLSNDAELAARLLSDGVLDGHRALDVLTGRLASGVEILGAVLLAHGVAPDQIARRISSQRFWEGEESNAIKSDIA